MITRNQTMIGATEAKRVIDLYGCLGCRGGRRIPHNSYSMETCMNKRVSKQEGIFTGQRLCLVGNVKENRVSEQEAAYGG